MRTKTLIIGFGHKARRGKDTVVAHLIEKFKDRYDIRRYAFADELKFEFSDAVREEIMQGASALDAIRELETWAGVKPDLNMDMSDPRCPYGKPRSLLQWWGTEYRREGRVPGESKPTPDEFYWVRKVRERIRKDEPQIALISDMRFYNEAGMIKSEDVTNKTVRVEREGFELGSGSDHPSEHELDGYGYDYVIHVKDGDLPELLKDAEFVMNHIIEQMKTGGLTVVPDNDDEQGELITILPAAKKPTYNISTPAGTQMDVKEEDFMGALVGQATAEQTL